MKQFNIHPASKQGHVRDVFRITELFFSISSASLPQLIALVGYANVVIITQPMTLPAAKKKHKLK